MVMLMMYGFRKENEVATLVPLVADIGQAHVVPGNPVRRRCHYHGPCE